MAAAFVAGNTGFTSVAGTTFSLAVPQAVLQGQTIVVVGMWTDTGGTTTATVADDLGNTYTPIAGSLARNATGVEACQLFSKAGVTGSPTVTLTTSVSVASRTVHNRIYSGLSGVVHASNGTTSAASNPSITVTTTKDACMVVSGVVGTVNVVGASSDVTNDANGDTSEDLLKWVGGAAVLNYTGATGQYAMAAAAFEQQDLAYVPHGMGGVLR